MSLAAVLLFAGCSQMAPTGQVSQGANPGPAPGKAVIYVMRTPMDSREPGTLALDDQEQVTTLRGSVHRWEVSPGVHRIAGVGPASTSFTLTTSPGNTYFVEYTVTGTLISGVQLTALRQINEKQGRAILQRSQM